MSLDSFTNPKIIIGRERFDNISNITLSEKGGVTINSLNVTLTDPNVDEFKFYNKEILFYLDESDGIPMFRGYIRQINPSDTSVSLTAYDPRTFLTGKEAALTFLTDKVNYDGYTVSQFIYDYVKKYVNTTDTTYIGLDMITETDPPALLKNIRAENGIAPYKLITGNLPVKTKDLNKPTKYSIKMVDDGEKSNIVILQDKDIEGVPAITYSEFDGIIKKSFKRRPEPSVFTISDESGKVVQFKKGNTPKGPIGTRTPVSKDINTGITTAIVQSILDEGETQEISITVSKGYYLQLGALVKLDVNEQELRTNHRLKSKTLSWTPQTLTCNLVLNKEIPVASSYIQL
tara:strand:- start:455 stop:1492 length:1038 start_codon:yes stop_codon:yes gene_type:complete